MKLLYEGKTKDVYDLENGHYLLKFKDDVTGEDGVFDPGANKVGLKIDGMGKSGLKMTKYFFEKLKEEGLPSHYISADPENLTMEVLPGEMFGRGIEVICRYKAVGSFIRRYGMYAEEGQDLDQYVEVTLKDDERNDPLITKDGLIQLKILSEEDYNRIIDLTRSISELVRKELLIHGVELYDIKLEFGKHKGEIILIDEISGGNMRAYGKDGYIEPFDLEKIILG